MPVLVGAAMMDTERMIPTPQQNGSSPGESNEPINATDSSGVSNAHNSSTSPPAMVVPSDQHSLLIGGPGGTSNAFISPAPLYINSATRKKKSERPPPPPVPPAAGQGLLGHPDHLAGGGMDASSSLSIGQPFGTSRPQPPPPPAINIPPTPASMNHYVNEAVAMGGNGGIVNMGYAKDSAFPMNDASRLNATRDTTLSMSMGVGGGGVMDDSDGEQQEVIEVQILPQDDNWGGGGHHQRHHNHDNSEYDGGGHNGNGPLIDAGGGTGKHGRPSSSSSMSGLETGRGMGFRCRHHAAAMTTALLAMLSLASPVLMVALPSLRVLGLREQQLLCGVDCDGMLVTLAVKLLVLAAGSWAVFARRSRATLPRVRIYRAVVFVLVLIFLCAFWLFYAAHLIHERELVQYKGLVGFASGLVDSLLFVHYLAVLLLELRHRVSEQYYIKVVRSPDGESRGFPAGPMSVQRAASWVLDKYYTDFPTYNPYLDRLVHPGVPGNRGSRRGVKVYDLDGPGANINDGNSTVVSVASKRGKQQELTTPDHHRFLEEYDHERKVRKRKARLLTATEEAFTHIRRLRENQNASTNEKTPMESYEAAQAIFPSLSRPLQKYLRATRQQPNHTQESVLEHLSTCLSFDMSPRSFLERYLVGGPAMVNSSFVSVTQHWSLVSERSLYRDLSEGCVFQLRQGEVSLLCSVQRLPHVALSEEIIEPDSNRFVLRISSETSV